MPNPGKAERVIEGWASGEIDEVLADCADSISRHWVTTGWYAPDDIRVRVKIIVEEA